MTDMTRHRPPTSRLIRNAELVAQRSPCAKSKRGAIVYIDVDVVGDYIHISEGYNGMVGGYDINKCDGSDACRKACNQRCVHAEMRAIRDIHEAEFLKGIRAALPGPAELQLVHVKIGNNGTLVAGGPPSCWQCSREILDQGRIHRVWLYQRLDRGDGESVDQWCSYSAQEFHVATLRNCGLLTHAIGIAPFLGDA